MGLAFSVPSHIQTPPSLVNIFKELESDIDGFIRPKSGSLVGWASQGQRFWQSFPRLISNYQMIGVLLLNAVLTVKAHEANSHANKGWEDFTDAVINICNTSKEHCVFMVTIFWM